MFIACCPSTKLRGVTMSATSVSNPPLSSTLSSDPYDPSTGEAQAARDSPPAAGNKPAQGRAAALGGNSRLQSLTQALPRKPPAARQPLRQPVKPCIASTGSAPASAKMTASQFAADLIARYDGGAQ